MSEIIMPLVYQFGLGGVGGFILGFALKKVAKIFIVVIGIFILAMLYLGVGNIVNVNYSALSDAVGKWFGTAGQSVSWIVGLVSLLPFVGSFMLGFFLGFKLG
jgi:uncharacterized membrane protein (Fun14 family)